MKKKSVSGGLSLRTHLILFGMGIVLPVLIFAGLLFGQIQAQERRRTEGMAAALAVNVATDVAREISRDRLVLRSLATNTFLRDRDIEAFGARSRELGRFIGGEIALRLEPVATTSLDASAPLVPVGDVTVAPEESMSRDGRNSFALSLALQRGGQPAGTLTMRIPSSRLSEILNEEAAPDGWSTRINDASGKKVAGSANGSAAGATGTGGAAGSGNDALLWRSLDASGRPALVATRAIAGTNWTASAEVPAKLLTASMQRSVAVLAWLGGLLVLLSFLLALFFGRRLASPIREVTRAAASLPEGSFQGLPLSPVHEANELGRVLTEAARVVQAKTADLRRAHDELANIYDGSPVGIGLFDRNGKALRVNKAFKDLALPESGDDVDLSAWLDFRSLLDETTQSLGPLAGSDLVLDDGTRRRVFRASAFRAGCPQDEESAIGVTLEDVTIRRDAETALLESNARIRRLLDANFFGVALVTDGVLTEANDAFLATLARSRDEVEGILTLRAITPPDLQVLDDRALEEVAETGTCKAFEKDLLRADGRRVPALVGYARLGLEPLSVICFALDLTEQRQRDTQRRYLMRELTHRTKNLLAVVQAMALQTAKGSSTPAEFHERFAARLQGLAGSHDLLVQENWSGASMGDLVRSQLGHYAETIGTQIHLDGPRILLEPDAAQNLGMALHELSTNAAKYGSLSVPEGRVDITWRIVPAEGDHAPRLIVDWRESGGPKVVPPKRKGFGHVVMDRLAARAMDGHVQMTFAPEGVHWRLTAPATSAHSLDGSAHGPAEATPTPP